MAAAKPKKEGGGGTPPRGQTQNTGKITPVKPSPVANARNPVESQSGGWRPPTPTQTVVTTDPFGIGGGGGGTDYAPQGEVVTPPAAFSSVQILENLLKAALGVEGLGQWAFDLKNRGASEQEIVHALRYGTDTSDAGKKAREKYLAAFPQMDKFLKEGIFIGEDPEKQYMDYRNTVREAASRYGVGASLVTNDRIADFIGGRNSAAEIVDRMNIAATAISTTPVETYQVLDEYYGVKSRDLMDFYLDTDRTEAELQKRYTAARIGTEAARNRFGIDSGFAENLAQRGITVDEANKGFGSAYAQSGFMSGKGETIGRQGLAEGQFGDVTSASTINRIAASRRAGFEGAAQFEVDKTGVSGLASAAT
jgi:hypothetical protein